MSGDRNTVILFLNHWARRMGGAEHSLMDMLTFMHDKCACHIATAEEGRLTEKAGKIGVAVHVVPCRASLERIRRWGLLKSLLIFRREGVAFFRFVVRLKKTVDKIKPHLIHANVPKSHVALFLLRLLGYNGICCFHLREIFGEHSAAMGLYRLLFPRRRGYIIAISRAVKNALPPRLRSKTTVLYNGVTCVASRESRQRNQGLKLLYLGRVVPWKGCHTLVDIFKILKEKYPSETITLSLTGDTLYWSDRYRGELEQRILRYNLSSSCVLSPHTDNPETVYLAHDVFCNASLNEPFGRVVAEAQGCGLPVVAFNSGGIPEIVVHNETGLLVHPGDNEGFAEAISTFITHPEIKQSMGDRGRERTMRFFNKAIQIPRIYSFLIEKSGLQDEF